MTVLFRGLNNHFSVGLDITVQTGQIQTSFLKIHIQLRLG